MCCFLTHKELHVSHTHFQNVNIVLYLQVSKPSQEAYQNELNIESVERSFILSARYEPVTGCLLYYSFETIHCNFIKYFKKVLEHLHLTAFGKNVIVQASHGVYTDIYCPTWHTLTAGVFLFLLVLPQREMAGWKPSPQLLMTTQGRRSPSYPVKAWRR